MASWKRPLYFRMLLEQRFGVRTWDDNCTISINEMTPVHSHNLMPWLGLREKNAFAEFGCLALKVNKPRNLWKVLDVMFIIVIQRADVSDRSLEGITTI